MNQQYAWTTGAHIKAAAQAIGEQLDVLQHEHGGRLTPRIVVDAARPDDSPLHPAFEWDNARAAELYRENQARHLIACVRIVSSTPTATTLQRMFVNVIENVGDDEQQAYVPIARVLADAELFQQVCDRAARDLRAFEDRYAQFEALASIARDARARIESVKLTTR